MSNILGKGTKGLVFIISAPAGTGKTTLMRKLAKEFPCVYQSVSCTTRPMRTGEVEGKDYHFMSEEEFEKGKARGDFLESAAVFGYHYASSRRLIEKKQEEGKHVFLVIDTQGTRSLRQQGFAAISIFISPPSLVELERRLVDRNTDSPSVIEKRLAWAKKELEEIKYYDYHVVNDQLEDAYDVLRSIVIAEEHRVSYQKK